jgi:propanediol utilization protein
VSIPAAKNGTTTTTTTTTAKLLPVFPAARHVRLSAAHARMLFGDKGPRALHHLHNGLDASDAVVSVSIGDTPRGKLELVRVLLPLVKHSLVHVCAYDVEGLGLPALGTTADRSPGCALSGPQGIVVLAEGVVAAERVVMPASSSLGRPRVDVQIEGERPRFLRNMPVEEGSPGCVVVADTSGDLRPGVMATVLA